jgi:hypothetical protein
VRPVQPVAPPVVVTPGRRQSPNLQVTSITLGRRVATLHGRIALDATGRLLIAHRGSWKAAASGPGYKLAIAGRRFTAVVPLQGVARTSRFVRFAVLFPGDRRYRSQVAVRTARRW